MSDFEFVFALYSLILGLSMVELLSGLGRVLEVRFAHVDDGDRAAIGWLTPLLAIFVMLDLLSFWSAAWVVRDSIHVSRTTLLAVTTFASLYFLAARLVFPSQPERFASLDAHYFRVRRTVLGLLFILLVAQLGFYLTDPLLVDTVNRPIAWVMTLILAALMIAAMVVNSRAASISILVALVARYVMIYVVKFG